MAEAMWTAEEMKNLGEAMHDLQERLQSWEIDNDLKIGDLLLTVKTPGRNGNFLGLVSMPNATDTVIQFEVVDIDPSLIIA
jgi:hypothetical protein